MPPTQNWLSIGDTHLLMRPRSVGEIEEWHPIAQVTLRQIYPEVPPMYYAWWCTASQTPITKMERLEEAMAAVDVATRGC